MRKTYKNFCPVRAAHMHRKLETGKRCICAFPHRLENGRYLPPIFRAIGLHVQKLNKKLTAYAEACEYPYGYFKGEDRMRDASPFILSRFCCMVCMMILARAAPSCSAEVRQGQHIQ